MIYHGSINMHTWYIMGLYICIHNISWFYKCAYMIYHNKSWLPFFLPCIGLITWSYFVRVSPNFNINISLHNSVMHIYIYIYIYIYIVTSCRRRRRRSRGHRTLSVCPRAKGSDQFTSTVRTSSRDEAGGLPSRLSASYQSQRPKGTGVHRTSTLW